MFKLVLTGLWVCAITLGSVYLSVQMTMAPAATDGAAAKKNTQVAQGEMITVPVIAEGKVAGYFLARISYIIDKDKVTNTDLPMTALVTDELFSLLIGNKMIDVANTASFDLNAFRSQIKDGLNRRLNNELITDVLVEQLDYLSKDDTRDHSPDSSKLSKTPVKIVEGTAVN